jgi:transposase
MTRLGRTWGSVMRFSWLGALCTTTASSVTNRRVTRSPISCECDDYTLRREPCKHVIACRFVQERDHGGVAPAIDTSEVPTRPTYKQDWPAYNKAQREEKHRFQVLLADLCSGVVDPPRTGVGRKPVPLADRIFSTVYKVDSTVSSRRFNCNLQDATERGYLSRSVHCNKVNSFLEDAELTPYLKALIARRSLPLRAVETDFAVASSGFSTSKFVRWFDEKYGVRRSGHDWVKVHIACGVQTNVISAAAIYGRDANDCPILPDLVKETAEHFTIKEVSADKAYLSVENVETVFAEGGIPFIAPKITTTGAIGGLFEKRFRYEQFQREEFLAHDHKRSNVESTFSAIKRKFGDHVRSRPPVAMVNEAFAKLVCHNLWCVILSQCEHGIEAVFWKDEAKLDEQADVLLLARPG